MVIWTVLQVSGGSLWFHPLLNTNNPSYFRTIVKLQYQPWEGQALRPWGPGMTGVEGDSSENAHAGSHTLKLFGEVLKLSTTAAPQKHGVQQVA